MFEARLAQGSTLKSTIEAMKDLVTDANLDCSANGLSLQAMDSSHVSLCALLMRADGFDHFRCDKNISLGLNLTNLGKILKCAGNDDIITMKSEDEGDTISFMFESENQERVSDFELKLMDIDADHLGIPETQYKCIVKMPSREFQSIVQKLQVLGDTCTIGAKKDGVRFSVTGDMGTGNILCRQNVSADKDEDQTVIDLQEDVEMAFALRYLSFFTKATSLDGSVTISMSPDVPIVVEYKIGEMGHLRFYLAPKIDDEEEGAKEEE